MKVKACLFAVLLAINTLAVAEESDTRTAVQLSPTQRAAVLTEMRQFLSGLQQISAALSQDDMDTVASVVRILTPMYHRYGQGVPPNPVNLYHRSDVYQANRGN